MSIQKIFFLLLGLLTVGLLVITGSSLESLEFSPGTPFSYLSEGDFSPYTPSIAFIMVMFGALAIFVLGLFLLTTWSRRKLGQIAIGVAVVIMILLIMAAVAALLQHELPESLLTPIAEVVLTPESLEEDPPFETEPGIDIVPQVFEEPPLSLWISFFFSLGTVLLVFALVGWLWRSNRPDERAVFVEIAEQAVHEIKSGKDWGDAIINCYASMLEAVSESRKIGLKDYSLTPAEFVALMVAARMPAAPAKRLTVLFERVRYGGKRASQPEIDEAVACLKDIIAACQGET